MDLAGEELGGGIAPAEFGDLIEIAIVELGEHRLQQVKSAADITNDPLGIERVARRNYRPRSIPINGSSRPFSVTHSAWHWSSSSWPNTAG